MVTCTAIRATDVTLSVKAFIRVYVLQDVAGHASLKTAES